MKIRVLSLVAVVLGAVGCGGDIDEYVNARFPPVTVEEQRQEAVDAAVAALTKLDAPNLAFGISLSEIEDLLLVDSLVSEGIKRLRLRSKRQLLEIRIDFKRTFTGEGEREAQGADIIARWKPTVSGRLTVYAGLAGDTQESISDTTLSLKVLPVFKTLKISKVKVAEEYDLAILGGALTHVLNRYADNISGQLSRLPLMIVDVPTKGDESIDPSKTIQIDGAGVKGTIRIVANPVASPVQLLGLAPIFTDDRILALAQFVEVEAVAGAEENSALNIDQTVESLVKNFEVIANESFGLETFPRGVWVAIRKDLVAKTVNSFFQQAQACFSVQATLDSQEFSEVVGFPDESMIDCTPARDCSPTRKCDFEKKHERRGCRKCPRVPCPTWRKPFRTCKKCFNDPVCEAAKASQNAAYEAEYVAKKADCERLKAQQKLQCEAEKTGQKLLCETGKETLKRLARSGNFARIQGGLRGEANLDVCIRAFTLSPKLDRIHTSLDFEGGADVDVALKFVPLDIAGHLVCQVPWTEEQRFQARIPQRTHSIGADIDIATGEDDIGFTFQVSQAELDLKLDPGPTEFLLTSANMNLACRGMDLLRPVILPAAGFVPELRGEFKHTIGPLNMRTNFDAPSLKVLDRHILLHASETNDALIVMGTLDPAD